MESFAPAFPGSWHMGSRSAHMGLKSRYMGGAVARRLAWPGSVILLILLNTCFTAAHAEIRVGKGERYRSVSNALLDAKRGETVRIIGGTYRFGDIELPHDVTIIGEGDVVFKAKRRIRKGILVPTRNAAIHVEGITFSGARSPDKNGAGIRFEGSRLTVVDCTFTDNENGILATGKSNSVIYVKNTRFVGSGHGDGYSHGLYMANGTGLVIENSLFEGTKEGHHVKSLAAETVIRRSRFIDAPGWPSYVVDTSKGGSLFFEENEIFRSAEASQQTLFNYDTTRGGVRGYAVLARNKITNAKKGARLFRNPEGVPIHLSDNDIANINGASLALPANEAGKKRRDDDHSRAISPPPAELPVFEERAPISVQDLNRLSPQQRRAVTKLLAARGEAPVGADTTASPPSGQPPDQSPDQASDQSSRAINGTGRDTIIAQPRSRARSARLQDSTAPTITARPSSTLMTLPSFEPVEARGDIVPLNIIRLNSAATPYATIGQVFKRGDLPKGVGAGLRLKGTTYPIQLDAKSFHEDGSVKHAALTLSVPKGLQGKGMIVAVAPGEAQPPTSEAQPLSGGLPAQYGLVIKISGTTGDGAPFSGQISLRNLWERSTTSWLKGPFAEERTGVVAIGPFLKVRADLRQYADGRVRTHLNFENYSVFRPGDRTLTYTIEILEDQGRQGSANHPEALFRKSVTQHRASSWASTLWHGSAPAYDVQHDAHYLAQTEAIYSYNFSHGISGRIVDQLAARINENGAVSMVTKYFPTTGARGEIGPLPQWDVAYLKTQSLKAKSIMLSIAQASGDIPWHIEDDKTGNPLRIDLHPSFWLDLRATKDNLPDDLIPESYFASETGGWTLDLAHKPLLAYTAYLVTADAHFARSLAHEAAYAISRTYTEERRREERLVVLEGQVRGRAWAFRDIANAAYILPDDWALTRYFGKIRNANLAALKKSYVTDGTMRSAGETEGYFFEENYRYPGKIAPWQHDYLFIMIAQEALRGSADARAVVKWAAKYQTGRILNGVMPPHAGIGYRIATFDPETRQKYKTWDRVGQHTEIRKEGDGNSGYGYFASGLAALSILHEVTGEARAQEAYQALLDDFPKKRLYDPGEKWGVYFNPHYDFLPPRPAAPRPH